MNIIEQPLELIRSRHVLIEDIHCQRYQARVCDPGTVVSVANFAFLVRPHFCQRALVGLRVVPDRNPRCHATHRIGAAPMAGLDKQLRIRSQEMAGHCDFGTIGQYEFRIAPEFLDETEYVVSAAAIQADDVVA